MAISRTFIAFFRRCFAFSLRRGVALQADRVLFYGFYGLFDEHLASGERLSEHHAAFSAVVGLAWDNGAGGLLDFSLHVRFDAVTSHHDGFLLFPHTFVACVSQHSYSGLLEATL